MGPRKLRPALGGAHKTRPLWVGPNFAKFGALPLWSGEAVYARRTVFSARGRGTSVAPSALEGASALTDGYAGREKPPAGRDHRPAVLSRLTAERERAAREDFRFCNFGCALSLTL